MMGIEEGTCQDEHRVLYTSNESQKSTPKTNCTLYTLFVSQTDNKLHLKNRKIKLLQVKKYIASLYSTAFVRYQECRKSSAK